jgi:hypothetical protein
MKTRSDLIIRFAKENQWRYKRIKGELKKLGYIALVSTIRRLLKKETGRIAQALLLESGLTGK